MNEKTYTTPLGVIHYWVHMISADDFTLVFLPGLTADHRLFEKQISFLKENTTFSCGMLQRMPLHGPLHLTLT